MEGLMWRASNVVISYGAIRGEAGCASGTQEKEKKSTSSSKGSFEKVRLAEKSSAAAAAAAATTSGNNGRSFTFAPLPFSSAKNFVPAPLRFLWFPENTTVKGPDEPSSSSNISSGTGVGGEDARMTIKIKEIADFVEEKREKEDVVGPRVEEDGGDRDFDVVNRELDGSRPDLAGCSETSNSDLTEDEGSEDELMKNVGKRWFQNFLNGRFLKKSPRVEVRIPSTETLEKADDAMTSVSTSLEHPIPAIQVGSEKSGAACDLKDAGKCVGCAAEADNFVVDSAASPLATLEVPHVNVNHDVESFSKFLSEVPLTELKLIAQTSFLSNLAYMIPELKAGELARYHHMLFVTSSVDIKAEARAKEKAEALAQEKAAAAAKLEQERNAPGSGAKQASYLSPEAAYALAAAATSFLRSQKKGFLVPSGGEGSAGVNNPKSDDSKSKEVTNLLEYDPIAAYFGVGLNDSEVGVPLDLSSQDMATFMRPVTSVVSAEKDTKQEVANNLRSLHTCPCDWFSCDEKGGYTRFFSIQGSESFSSWQANLLFEPIQFEHSALGVMVHRGIYEAAIGLYEQILPYVLEHQQSYGERAKFRFTGHSLGGSLSVLLTLMLNIRGVVKTDNLLPVYTFGAPYVMCGGDCLLKKLGFPLTHVQYIVMHRDIVPRSFTCNYPDHVAEVLKRVNGTFRDHTCLIRQRLLYAPMGQMMILQPDDRQSTPHPLLPSGCGLYVIQHQSHNEPTMSNSDDEVVPSRAVQVRAAQRAFLNKPHPLETLSDPGAYGSEGTIAKNHDPRNYAKAINSVLRQEMRRWRRVQRERRRQLWWPLVSADAAGAISRSASFGVQKEPGGSKGATSQGMCGPSGLSHYFSSDISAGRATFPVSVSGDPKGRLTRYKSLIASQHMQMGLVVLLTAKLFIEQGFGIVLAWV
ncbi:unnamed protein product [Calypogeia fissa]